jgi:hypothetical protein
MAVKHQIIVYFYRKVEVAFFVTVLKILQIQGVEMSTGGSIESNVRLFEAFILVNREVS